MKKTTDAKQSLITKRMAAMGAKGWEAMPTDQHQWPRAEGEPGLYRIWSLMCWFVLRSPNGENWFIYKGRNGTIQDIGTLLNMDDANVRHYWREGERKGLWKKEVVPGASGPPKLCLNGDVTAEEVGKANKRRSEVIRLSERDYILLQIKKVKLPEVEAELMWKEYAAVERVEDEAAAAAALVIRDAFTPHKDSVLRQRGIKPRRHQQEQGKTKRENPLLKLLAPVINEYVQTSFAFGRSEEAAHAESVAAHTSSNRSSDLSSERAVSSSAILPDSINAVGRSVSSESDRLTDELTEFVHEIGKRLGETPGPKLLPRIRKALGDAPLADLQAKAKTRWKAVTSLGILEAFAAEVRTIWEGARVDRERAKADRAREDAERAERLASETAELEREELLRTEYEALPAEAQQPYRTAGEKEMADYIGAKRLTAIQREDMVHNRAARFYIDEHSKEKGVGT